MAGVEAQCLLEVAILDYMSKRGFHLIRELFYHEIHANQNPVAIYSPDEAFLQAWWGKFYEAYTSRFPDFPVFAAESFDKVAQTVENVVANNGPANQSDASDHMGANTSHVVPSCHLMASSPLIESRGPDLMEFKISDLLSRDMALPRDMVLEMNKIDGMLPSASNVGYQMPIVPPEWNARDDRPVINLGGPTQMEPNIHAPANALPASLELADAGNNRFLQQGWPSVGVGSITPVISHEVARPSVIVPTQKEQVLRTTSFPQHDVLPNVAVQTLDAAPASSSDFLRMFTQAGSSGNMLGDTNKRTPENLPADQQIIAPIVQSGRKRKAPMSPVASVRNTVAGFAVPARTRAERGGISFKEIRHLHITKSKLLCCHFNSQGELLATAGHDTKVYIWELGNNNVNSGEGHTHHVTDVRFRPNSMVFATSSLDRTVKIWDAAKPSHHIQNLAGHAEQVMSIDFHPTKVGLLSSCDSNDEIRLWDVNSGDCKLMLKGGSRQVRFQPELGAFLASTTKNIINIFDVETNTIRKKLQGHIKDIRSICWDMSGNYLASVCEDSARIWSVSEEKCIFELFSGGNKFQSCTFHPGYSQVLVIGSHEFLEVWNPILKSNTTRTYSAHADIISSLACSYSKGVIASVSHDELIKIWR